MIDSLFWISYFKHKFYFLTSLYIFSMLQTECCLSSPNYPFYLTVLISEKRYIAGGKRWKFLSYKYLSHILIILCTN